MKVFAIISLIISAVMTLAFGWHTIKSWFDRKGDQFAAGSLLTVCYIIWLLTAIFLLRG